MVSLASEETTEDEGGRPGPPDPLRQVIHTALAIYLMPVVAIVCAIGGASILLDKATRAVGRLAIGPNRSPKHGHFAAVRPGSRGTLTRDPGGRAEVISPQPVWRRKP